MKKALYKMSLDILMLIAYFLLMFGYGFGGLFHEILGIITGLLFGLHLLLNIPMWKGLFHQSHRAPTLKTSLSLAADLLLVLVMPLVMITGILISYAMFGFDINPGILLFHQIFSWIGAITLAVHTGLHLRYIVIMLRKAVLSNQKQLLYVGMHIVAGIFCMMILQRTFYIAEYNGSFEETQSIRQSLSEEIDEGDDDGDGKSDNDTGNDTGDGNSDALDLEDFLSKLFCTACGRHCPLTSLHCGKGQAELEEAKQEYYTSIGEQMD